MAAIGAVAKRIAFGGGIVVRSVRGVACPAIEQSANIFKKSNQDDILRDGAELSVRVGKTVTNHDRLEVDLGDGRSRDQVKCDVVLVDDLECNINFNYSD